jgi:hypothetical protein
MKMTEKYERVSLPRIFPCSHALVGMHAKFADAICPEDAGVGLALSACSSLGRAWVQLTALSGIGIASEIYYVASACPNQHVRKRRRLDLSNSHK